MLVREFGADRVHAGVANGDLLAAAALRDDVRTIGACMEVPATGLSPTGYPGIVPHDQVAVLRLVPTLIAHGGKATRRVYRLA